MKVALIVVPSTRGFFLIELDATQQAYRHAHLAILRGARELFVSSSRRSAAAVVRLREDAARLGERRAQAATDSAGSTATPSGNANSKGVAATS